MSKDIVQVGPLFREEDQRTIEVHCGTRRVFVGVHAAIGFIQTGEVRLVQLIVQSVLLLMISD